MFHFSSLTETNNFFNSEVKVVHKCRTETSDSLILVAFMWLISKEFSRIKTSTIKKRKLKGKSKRTISSMVFNEYPKCSLGCECFRALPRSFVTLNQNQ